ncbi:Hypothetical Protein FCC1311_051992 [Hondaea fermentalgiana]|uniref:Channel forming colicins domain-containing protein n=1 Tax=Hondaea fermentalgiana TaxID=2315210 RepID=A0A2R5GGU2_9STRA|nr:Hypothetical Protein FCC1311_051992 [Hondaea fermentalgiana]|eukprot:GBG28978.1 Hypothetical Protein FCC1311_051992 [Hondaea fermentalgiana]
MEMASPLDDWGALGAESPKNAETPSPIDSSMERKSPEPIDMASEMGAQYMLEDPVPPRKTSIETETAAAETEPEHAGDEPAPVKDAQEPDGAHEMLDELPPESLLLLPENPPRLVQLDGTLMNEVELPDEQVKSPLAEPTFRAHDHIDESAGPRGSDPLFGMLSAEDHDDADSYDHFVHSDEDDEDEDGADKDQGAQDDGRHAASLPKMPVRKEAAVAPVPSDLQHAVNVVTARSAAFQKKKEQERQEKANIDESLLEELDDEDSDEGALEVFDEDVDVENSAADEVEIDSGSKAMLPNNDDQDAMNTNNHDDDDLADLDADSVGPTGEEDSAQAKEPTGEKVVDDSFANESFAQEYWLKQSTGDEFRDRIDSVCTDPDPNQGQPKDPTPCEEEHEEGEGTDSQGSGIGKSPSAGGGGNGGGERDVLEEFSLWLGLIKDRFHGPASTLREAAMSAEFASQQTPFEFDEAAGSPGYKALANPTFREGLSTAGRLSEMRRRAEDIAVRAANRHALLQDDSKSRIMASKIASFVQVLRLRAAAQVDGQADNFSENVDSEEDECALFIAQNVVRTGSWEPLLVSYELDRRHPDEAADKADRAFTGVLERQSKARRSINGELVRQYLNVVLRGLPASPALADMVRRIPSQNAALSYTGTPDCAYKLGKATAQFRRIFCDMYEGLFMPPLPSPSSNGRLTRNDGQLEAAVNDLSQFMSLLVRVIGWQYPELLTIPVREVVGDTSKGRMQDSRRGGWIPRSTKNPQLVVRSCVEDALVDPLLDNLYLAYNGICGEKDARVGQMCREVTQKLKEEELMAACGVPAFYRLEYAHPVARPAGYRRSLEAGGPSSPYQSAIDLMVSAWITARSPASKISVLSLAHQAIVDAAILHYSRPTETRDDDGNVRVRAAFKDQRKLIPRRREMLALFTHCVIMSLPPNLETQSRLLFDLGSRHAVAHSEVAAHAIAMLCMMPRSIEAVTEAVAS